MENRKLEKVFKSIQLFSRYVVVRKDFFEVCLRGEKVNFFDVCLLRVWWRLLEVGVSNVYID